MVDVFNTAIYVLISIIIVSLIFVVSVNLVGANLVPLFKHLTPNNTKGMSPTLYNQKIDHLETGLYYGFYILLILPFIFLIVKLLYEREETSVYSGY